MLAVRGVMTGVRSTRMVRDTVQIVSAARNPGGGEGTEIQSGQWKVHRHVQLAAKSFHGGETFQMNNKNLRELMYAEAFSALSPHLTLGTGRLLVTV